MANPKCVTAKYEVKDIFDKDLKPAVLKQMKETVWKQVDIYRGLEYIDIGFCKDGWNLTVTLLSFTVDDESKPPALEAKTLSIVGVPLFTTAKSFRQDLNRKVAGFNAKKIEQEAKSLVDDALVYLMKEIAIPKMLKSLIREEF